MAMPVARTSDAKGQPASGSLLSLAATGGEVVVPDESPPLLDATARSRIFASSARRALSWLARDAARTAEGSGGDGRKPRSTASGLLETGIVVVVVVVVVAPTSIAVEVSPPQDGSGSLGTKPDM